MQPEPTLPTPQQVHNSLSKQERLIFCLIAEDSSSRSIAQKLCISPHTVKNHKTNLIRKLNLGGAVALHHLAIQITNHFVFAEEFEKLKTLK
jgi:DNA-binding CsgD family transcriptional regulator